MLKRFYLQTNCFWRSDYDAILLTNQTSNLRLNQKAGVIFFNYVLKGNLDTDFYVENNIEREEIDNLISLLLGEGFISDQFVVSHDINPMPHVTKYQ